MDYIVTDTFEEANLIERTIFIYGQTLAVNAGYQLTNDGEVIGLNRGLSAPDAQATSSWDIPTQRLDGKWVLLHPKYHPSASDAEKLAALNAEIGEVTVETRQTDWFPDTD